MRGFGQEQTYLLALLYSESLINMAPKKRYYAPAKSKKVRIFFDYWDNVKHLTQGTSKPIYRGFEKLEEAERFMKEQGLDTVDIITAANAESEIQRSSSSEESVEMNVCNEEYEDRRKDGLVDSNIENSISNTARSIEDVEKSMNNEFNKIWMALSSITLNLSNLDTNCECKELSNQLLKKKETVLKLEATIETKENEIASLKEIIVILKENQNTQDKTSVWENVTQRKRRASQPPPIWPNTPGNANSMPIAQANRFEILSDSFQKDDTHGPCMDREFRPKNR